MRKSLLVRALTALTLTGAIAACGDDPTGAGSGLRARGRVYGINGSAPAGLRVMIDDGGTIRSVDVRPDGTFDLETDVSGDSVDIIIDATSPSARTHFPALIRHATFASLPELDIVMVPMQWTISSGTHAGRTIQVSVDTAFTPPCSTAGDTNCDGFYPIGWTQRMQVWPAAAYPIRLFFDRERSSAGVTITDADSVALWNVVNRMNSDYGFDLFRPAKAEDISFQSDGRPLNAVSIRIDESLSGFAAWTNWYWNGAGEMYSGVVRPRTLQVLRSNGVMTHELLHTQGFKHSCSWSTVMGGYGCGNFGSLSANDVAYAQLALAVASVQKSTGASYGLNAARNGQRVLMRGKPPVPVTFSFMAMLRGGDAIGEPMGDHAGHAHH